MEVGTGALGSLLPKLSELLLEEYHLHKRVKKDVESRPGQMKGMYAALRKVAEVPQDQLDEQLVLWAGDVRELSYTIEDVVDKFLVRMRIEELEAIDNSHTLRRLMQKMATFFRKGKTRRQIANAIKDINSEIQAVANRRGRVAVENIVPNPTPATTIDPRLRALYTEMKELVGIDGKRDQELIKLLSMGDSVVPGEKLKIVSVVGFGGLGKTTLVKAVYDKIKGSFDCSAFVPVGRNPDVRKIIRDILIDLGKYNSDLMILDERQLIDKLREVLEQKRYLIIIDDIWDEKLWAVIKLAFDNENSKGSRLITTTRIVSVSKACCSSSDGFVYEMKPLCDNDSKVLFYKRVFHERGCPSEFEEVSKDILKKCGGVPLAIITLASLLASDQYVKSKDEWQILHQSIGYGLTEDPSLEEMQRILSFSYYGLPSHLKTCLLYLTIYPEDSNIEREHLIWKWVSESFIQCGKQATSLFEIGETYFNELVNRSMIQPVYDGTGTVDACCVHDMVLDLICSLSRENFFVTVLDGTRDSTSFKSNIRRLSLQSRNEDRQGMCQINSMSASQLRSITVFTRTFNIIPALLKFDVLRVLDLNECKLVESRGELDLRILGNLFHLRYLDLAGTNISELPAEIGNLQFLQVLDVGQNFGLKELPPSVCKLIRLMFLNFHFWCYMPPSVLGNLASLEVLSDIYASIDIVQDLRNLERLRELAISFDGKCLDLEKAFVESVCSLHNIQCLTMQGDFEPMDILGECCFPTRYVRQFNSYYVGVFSALPTWIKRDPTHLSRLSELIIHVDEVKQEDVEILGRLPALRHLLLATSHQTQRLLTIRADGFRCMVDFILDSGSGALIVFEQGALPRAERVTICLAVRVAKEDGNGDFNLGLHGNMPSLRFFRTGIHWRGAMVGEAKEAEAAVRHALHDHLSIPAWNSMCGQICLKVPPKPPFNFIVFSSRTYLCT
ncbi:LOW QUALITY PROTEIN: hypothetical protein CFC21_004973 [Triticum aestivum]|uniref:Uncharacterized protein n=2 Tax=Triticum aestivum TaxID=4565 RepID=A0A3B5YQQ1_WHEAT|nr:LOW QUALITY PROTEIN: hypothetical protein CFC21_004973 [Triticum aestivum]